MSARYFPGEDPPEDPPEDFANNVHPCGWNDSLRLWRGEYHQTSDPKPEVRAKLAEQRAYFARRAAEHVAAGRAVR